jgi:hypothetical protein
MRTHIRRWRKVAQQPTPLWDERNQFIANLIPAGSSVLDIGSGGQSIKRHLKPGCHYQPCDLVKSTPDVILCDFNAGRFPEISRQYDYVVCSGVMEYIRNPLPFLEAVTSYGSSVIISYHPYEPGSPKWKRLAVNWITHISQAKLEGMFSQVAKWKRLPVTAMAKQSICFKRNDFANGKDFIL